MKKHLIVYIFLVFVTTICMINELVNNDIKRFIMCIVCIGLMTLPFIIQKKFRLHISSIIKIMILLLLFCSQILGEINNFYGKFKWFDVLLHLLSRFILATFAFSMMYPIRDKIKKNYIILFVLGFSVMLGLIWEVVEFGIDNVFKSDMQKDEIVYNIKTVKLDSKKNNNVINIKHINHTILYDNHNNELVVLDGYLDIGLYDTMKDLVINFVGTFIFSFFVYLYKVNNEKYKFLDIFITRKER